MDPVQNMPILDALANKDYSPSQWLQYYKNVWTRNLIARVVDVETDRTIKAANPNEDVQLNDGSTNKIGWRLEERKLQVMDARKLLEVINALIALPESDLLAKWGDEALKVSPDMIKPKEATPEVGQPCQTPDGKTGLWMKDGEKMICMPQGESKTDEAAPGEKEASKV